MRPWQSRVLSGGERRVGKENALRKHGARSADNTHARPPSTDADNRAGGVGRPLPNCRCPCRLARTSQRTNLLVRMPIYVASLLLNVVCARNAMPAIYTIEYGSRQVRQPAARSLLSLLRSMRLGGWERPLAAVEGRRRHAHADDSRRCPAASAEERRFQPVPAMVRQNDIHFLTRYSDSPFVDFNSAFPITRSK